MVYCEDCLNDIERKPYFKDDLKAVDSLICVCCGDELSDADTLNDIENRLRQNKEVSEKEVYLLLESYVSYSVNIPSDIKIKLKSFLK